MKTMTVRENMAIRELQPFIDYSQMAVMKQNCNGEEGEWFRNKFTELATIIKQMPVTYETDGNGDKAIVYLHYFTGGWDWYILEKDSRVEQREVFGLAVGYEAELGYIYLDGVLGLGAELDLHWEPKSLAEVKAERGL